MTECVCPDCGHANEPVSARCEACHFPLHAEGAPASAAVDAEATGTHLPGLEHPLRPIRPRRPAPPSNQALSLWLVFGTFMALVVVSIAVKANYDRAMLPIVGSNPSQQANADSVLQVLARDSTNILARVRLGDILYDTGNWSEAIVQYRAAVRLDSSLATAIVDLGVCYYNLSDPIEAERHFMLALARNPHLPEASYNLGIVHERRKDYRRALGFFHRALQSGPPEGMHQPLVEAMARVQELAGAKPPPLPDGR